MAHSYKPVMVWTLRHATNGETIQVTLPDGFIPDDEWELVNVASVKPRVDSEEA